MEILKYNSDVFKTYNGLLNFVNDWFDLSIITNTKTHLLSYALINKNDMQYKIKIGKRTVYNSHKCLKGIQTKLIPLFSSRKESAVG